MLLTFPGPPSGCLLRGFKLLLMNSLRELSLMGLNPGFASLVDNFGMLFNLSLGFLTFKMGILVSSMDGGYKVWK